MLQCQIQYRCSNWWKPSKTILAMRGLYLAIWLVTSVIRQQGSPLIRVISNPIHLSTQSPLTPETFKADPLDSVIVINRGSIRPWKWIDLTTGLSQDCCSSIIAQWWIQISHLDQIYRTMGQHVETYCRQQIYTNFVICCQNDVPSVQD